MLVTSGKCVSQLLGADKGPVIPDVSPNVVRWPMSVAVGRQHGHDVVMVLCSRIDRGHSGSFGFTFLGTTAAVFEVEPGQAPQLEKVVDITPDSRSKKQVNWGAAATVHGAWFYVYGTRLTGRPYDFGRELYLARTPAADPGNRKRWQVWDGGGLVVQARRGRWPCSRAGAASRRRCPWTASATGGSRSPSGTATSATSSTSGRHPTRGVRGPRSRS